MSEAAIDVIALLLPKGKALARLEINSELKG